VPLSPTQELLEIYGDQLRSKISSKFSASTFLAGFAGAILTALVTSGPDQESEFSLQYPVALALTTFAAISFVQGIIRLDELSMPKRFWPSDANAPNRAEDVGLLTQDDLWVLHNRMVYYWRLFTMVATTLTGVGIFVLVLPAVHIPAEAFSAAIPAAAVGGALLAFAYAWIVDASAPERDRLIRPVD
jgi:hypothetical protein